MSRASFALLVAISPLPFFVACIEDFKSCEGTADCAGRGGEAGASSGGRAEGGGSGDGAAGGETACDETQSPAEAACRLRDDSAIFVAPSGDDLSTGTRDAPLRSLTEAIARAAEQDKFVAACTGTYIENVSLGGTLPVAVYGGFDCDRDAWVKGSTRSRVVPESGVPLTIDRVTAHVHLEGIEFTAPDASELGESSVAAFVTRSMDVTFVDVKLAAGSGASGADGVSAEYQLPAVSEFRGRNATTVFGAPPCAVSCPNGVVPVGGGGGDGISAGVLEPEPGDSGLPDYGGGRGGMVDAVCEPPGLGRGQDGAVPSAMRAAGASRLGSLKATGFSPSDGEAGPDGAPGQGGGGGCGGAMSGGGGGGCGGCGGHGGASGKGAGGSIALLVYQSTVSVSASELVTKDGGSGGAGAEGQAGQPGGPGGQPASPTACGGGRGAAGADGGAGGGGAGGGSVGVLYVGNEPAIGSGVTFGLGRAGAGGRTNADAANAGIDGVRERILEL